MFLRGLRNFLLVFFPLVFVGILAVGMYRYGRLRADFGPLPTLPVGTATPTPTPVAAGPGKKPVPLATPAGKSGTLSGSVVYTPWGPVEVSATIANGTLTAVDTPQYPDSPPSVYAKSYLIRQAIAAGSANIQGVSGATYTSAAFAKSLENALAKQSTL